MRRICILQKIQQKLQWGLQGQGDGGRTDKGPALHVSRVSILVNVALIIRKPSAGILAHSNAMISDAVHSTSDVFSILIVMAKVTITAKQLDKEHPFGHERMECAMTLLLTVVLLAIGTGIGFGAVRTIFQNRGTAAVPGFLAMAAALVSIDVKEWIYRYTKKTALEIRPGALIANAWYRRLNALSSIGTLVGAGRACLGVPLMDLAASLVICIFIGKAALDVLKDSLNQMVDGAYNDGTSDSIRVATLRSDDMERMDGLETHLFGLKVYVEVEIAVDRNMKLEQVHRIAKNARNAVREEFPQVKHCLVQASSLSGEEGEKRLV